MTNIPKVSLEDTLYLVQLMRETALAQGKQTQASRLNPVMEKMQGLVSDANQTQSTVAPSSGIVGQADFKKLLEVAQTKDQISQAGSNSSNTVTERNRLVTAMADASMSETDIARQLGMTRGEVHLVLNVHQKNQASGGITR
jgi:transcriptional regulator with GAF, ATPase, and Fis domain